MVNYNNKAFKVAKYAVMLALIVVGTVLDRTFTVYLPITGATIEMLMTLSLCFLFNSWLDGVLAGTFMGLASFITAFPFTKIIPQNPLVSIIPRIIVGILAFSAYRLMLFALQKVKNKVARQTIAIVPACLVGLVVNTVLFLGSAILLQKYYGAFADIEIAFTLISILPEYIVGLLCVAPLVLGVRRALKLGIDGNNWKLARNDEIVNVTVTADNEEIPVQQNNETTNDEGETK